MQAAGVRAELEQVTRAQQHIEAVAQRVAMNERDFVAANEAVKANANALARLHEEVPSVHADATTLRESLPQLIEAERLGVSLHRTREDALAAEADLEGVVTQRHAQVELRDQTVKAHAAAQQRAFRVDERRQKMLQTMRGEQQLKKVRALAVRMVEERERLHGECNAVQTLEARMARNEAALKAHREAHTASLAATLAATLTPGRPCPVCGAVDHPKVTEASAHARESLAEDVVPIDDAGGWEREIEADGLRLKALQSEVAALEVSLHGADQRQQGIWEGIDGAFFTGHDRPLPTPAVIQSVIEKVQAQLALEQEALAEAEAADDALAALALAAEQAQTAGETLERAHAALTERAERARADEAAAEQKVQEHHRVHPIAATIDHATALQQLRDLDAAKAAHAKNIERAEKSLGQAKAQAQTSEALLAAAMRDKDAAFAAQHEAEVARAAALADAGFEDVAAAEAASLDHKAREALRRDVEQAADKDRECRQALLRCLEKAEGVVAADVSESAIANAADQVANNERAQSELAQSQGRLASRLANFGALGERTPSRHRRP